MPGKGATGPGPPNTADERDETERARERMIARHKLIEAMIRNNELQLRNERARGGAEIERAYALREAALPGAGEQSRADVEDATRRFRELREEHDRLVAERVWLNASLLEFDSGPSTAEHDRAGHA
jgi:hypothetical protein